MFRKTGSLTYVFTMRHSTFINNTHEISTLPKGYVITSLYKAEDNSIFTSASARLQHTQLCSLSLYDSRSNRSFFEETKITTREYHVHSIT